MQFSEDLDKLFKDILKEGYREHQSMAYILARVAVECYKLGKKETALDVGISKADR